MTQAGDRLAGEQPAERDLGVSVDNKLNAKPAMCPDSKGGKQHPELC